LEVLTGWEKRMAQLSPMKLWNEMGPFEVSASKSGAVEPRRRLWECERMSVYDS
jgi:hypothetical protein